MQREPGAGTTEVVSRRTRAPTALATGAPQDGDPNDSGLMISGSPRDRNVRTGRHAALALASQPPIHSRPSIAWTLVSPENIVNTGSVSVTSWSGAAAPNLGPPSSTLGLSILRT